MTEDPIKIHLDSSTYITKVNGKLVVVRERRERLRDICMDLLGEAFGKHSRRKMKDGTKTPESEKITAKNPTATPFQNFPTPPLYNPNANLMGPGPVQSVIGPMGPQPGVFRFGNRQLALLPLNTQGGPTMVPQMGYPYPQPPWMIPQTSNISSFNFPPIGIDPRQFITNTAPPSEAATQTSVTVTKHVCAECGNLRSRKYQHENPLKPGETPPQAFCKKCQKDITSTEESDSGIRNTEKRCKQSKKGRKKKTKVKIDIDSSDESIESNESRKVSKPKQKESRNQLLDGVLATEGIPVKSSRRRTRIHLHDNEEHIASHEEDSPTPGKAHVGHKKSTIPSRDLEEYPPVHHSRVNYQAQRSSRESVATDAAEAFHHSRRMPSQSTFETYEADGVSNQSRNSEDSVSSEPSPRVDHNFADPIISTSWARSEEASRHRRLERSIDRQGFHPEVTGLPQGIYPPEDDEFVALTERCFIQPRPRCLLHVQEENLESRRQNSLGKATVQAEKPYPRFAAEAEASDYYRNDWSGAGEHDKEHHERVRRRDLENSNALVNSHNSDSSSSSHYRARTDGHYLPRARSPLSQPHQERGLRAEADLSGHDVSYTPSKDDSLPSRVNKKYTIAPGQEMTTRGQKSNTYRPPYVREATDRGTERALMPSPKHSHENMFYPDTNDSEITEEIERVERRVTFLDPKGYGEGCNNLGGKTGSARTLREERRR